MHQRIQKRNNTPAAPEVPEINDDSSTIILGTNPPLTEPVPSMSTAPTPAVRVVTTVSTTVVVDGPPTTGPTVSTASSSASTSMTTTSTDSQDDSFSVVSARSIGSSILPRIASTEDAVSSTWRASLSPASGTTMQTSRTSTPPSGMSQSAQVSGSSSVSQTQAYETNDTSEAPSANATASGSPSGVTMATSTDAVVAASPLTTTASMKDTAETGAPVSLPDRTGKTAQQVGQTSTSGVVGLPTNTSSEPATVAFVAPERSIETAGTSTIPVVPSSTHPIANASVTALAPQGVATPATMDASSTDINPTPSTVHKANSSSTPTKNAPVGTPFFNVVSSTTGTSAADHETTSNENVNHTTSTRDSTPTKNAPVGTPFFSGVPKTTGTSSANHRTTSNESVNHTSSTEVVDQPSTTTTSPSQTSHTTAVPVSLTATNPNATTPTTSSTISQAGTSTQDAFPATRTGSNATTPTNSSTALVAGTSTADASRTSSLSGLTTGTVKPDSTSSKLVPSTDSQSSSDGSSHTSLPLDSTTNVPTTSTLLTVSGSSSSSSPTMVLPSVMLTQSSTSTSAVLQPTETSSKNDNSSSSPTPTNLTASTASTAASSPVSTAPALPAAIAPPQGIVMPNSSQTLVEIGFTQALNYEFVVSNALSTAQILTFLPEAVSYALNISAASVFSNSLRPYPKDGYNATVAYLVIPSSETSVLEAAWNDTMSALYEQPNSSVQTLVVLIDTSIPLFLSSTTRTSPGTSGGGSTSTSKPKADTASYGGLADVNTATSTSTVHNVTKIAGIGFGAAAAAGAYGSLMFLIARRRRLQNNQPRRFSRVPSMAGSAAAITSRYGGVAISGPMNPENSLGI